jgi:hypothetical protein
MSPAQREAARTPLEEIFAKADALPSRPKPRIVEDMIPLITKLRDEKQLSWTDIASWMNNNTEFNRSSSFWSKLYKGYKVQIKTVVTAVDIKPKQPTP